MLKDKIRGLFLGVAIGDSLGLPYEGCSYESLKNIPRDAKLNKISDDTQLTLACADAIIKSGLNMDAIAEEHVKAAKETVAGWGSTTREAVYKIRDGANWKDSGNFNGQENRGKGNGIPMKIAPVAAHFAVSKDKNFDFLVDFTAMTHQTSVAVSSAFAHATVLCELLHTEKKNFNAKDLIRKAIRASEIGRSYFANTLTDDLTDRLRTLLTVYDIPDLLYSTEYLIGQYGRGSCYVYNSLPFSYAFFLRGPFSMKTLFEVAYAGGDTDTNASLVGGMMGALIGPDAFPSNLIDGLEEKDRILKTADDLTDALYKN